MYLTCFDNVLISFFSKQIQPQFSSGVCRPRSDGERDSAYLSRGKYGYEGPVTVDEQLSAAYTLIGNLTIRSSHCDKDIVD